MENQFVFTIRQHTPLIHFHDHDGATLRATELKPKLDKHLIERHEPELKSKKLIAKTPDGNGKYLDYKVAISCKSAPKTEEITFNNQPPCYFGAMGQGSATNLKFISYTDDDIKLSVFSWHPELLKLIREEINLFFALNNFGTRQSKGYGSFYLKEGSEGHKDIEGLLKGTRSCITYSNDGYSSKNHHENIFKDIDLFYRIMKSGFNFPNHKTKKVFNLKKRKDIYPPDFQEKKQTPFYYIKSFLHSYFLDKDIGNEKNFMKNNFLQMETGGPDHRYVRALLGLSDKYEFIGAFNTSVGLQTYERHTNIKKISVSNPDIERYKSPILFKVVGQQVFVFAADQKRLNPGTKFTFKDEGKETGIPPEKLAIPGEELNFPEFLESYTRYLASEKKKFQDKKWNFLPKPLIPLSDFFTRVNPTFHNP